MSLYFRPLQLIFVLIKTTMLFCLNDEAVTRKNCIPIFNKKNITSSVYHWLLIQLRKLRLNQLLEPILSFHNDLRLAWYASLENFW